MSGGICSASVCVECASCVAGLEERKWILLMEMDDFLVVLVVIRTGDGQFKTGARLEGVRYAPRVETAVRLP